MISLLRDAFDEVKSAKMIEEDRQGSQDRNGETRPRGRRRSNKDLLQSRSSPTKETKSVGTRAVSNRRAQEIANTERLHRSQLKPSEFYRVQCKTQVKRRKERKDAIYHNQQNAKNTPDDIR